MNAFNVAMLLNWGPIMGIAMFPVQVWITQRGSAGFQQAVALGVTLIFAGSLIRSVPSICSEDFRQSQWSMLLLHIGQILNAAAGPLCMGTESRLSCLWFREKERATATGIAVTASGVGTTVGFLLGPAVVRTPALVPHLLYLEAALVAVPFLCFLVHYPAQPTRPPSAAAAAIRAQGYREGSEELCAGARHVEVIGQEMRQDKVVQSVTFWQSLRIVARDRHYCALVLAAGIVAGVLLITVHISSPAANSYSHPLIEVPATMFRTWPW